MDRALCELFTMPPRVELLEKPSGVWGSRKADENVYSHRDPASDWMMT